MEFLKANGFCSYLGLGKNSEKPSTSASVTVRNGTCPRGLCADDCSHSSSTSVTVPIIQAIGVLGSRDRWRGPPDDDSLVETPIPGKAIRRIRMPRMSNWKKLDFSMRNSFEGLTNDDEDDTEENVIEFNESDSVDNACSAANSFAYHPGAALFCAAGHACHRGAALSSVAANEWVQDAKDKVQRKPRCKIN